MLFEPELFQNYMSGTVPDELLCGYKGHKIFAFSDTHGMFRRLSIPAEAEIFICAGDACEGFNPADLQDFFAWYTSIPAKLRIFVAGNHDRIFNQEPIRARDLILGGVVYLDRELGYKQLFLSVASARPKYHIFGHVHEEGLQRKAMLGGTTFLNVSYFEELRRNLKR